MAYKINAQTKPPPRDENEVACREARSGRGKKRIGTSCGVRDVSLYGLVVEHKEDEKKQ